MPTPMETLKKKRAEAVSRIIGKGYLATKRVYVGSATCENAAGAEEVFDVFRKQIETRGLTNIYLSRKGCAGRCNLEPTVEVIEQNKNPIRYGKIDAEKAKDIIQRHLLEDEVILDWIID